MKSFFEPGVYEELVSRIENLKQGTPAYWGKMDTSQMLYHCQIPLNIILEKKHYNLKPNWLINFIFKKSLYSDKQWRKNMPTAKDFIIRDKKDFNKEKKALQDLLTELNGKREKTNWKAHPAFGELTKEQWGKMQYKHLDHHLRQFGV